MLFQALSPCTDVNALKAKHPGVLFDLGVCLLNNLSEVVCKCFNLVYCALQVGTLLRSSNDSNWVNAALDSLMPDSQGRRDWNHIMCLNSSVDPWTAYFGDHAERLKAVKQRYDPHNRVNALDCALLEAA